MNLSLNWIFGKLFTPMAWAMGVPAAGRHQRGHIARPKAQRERVRGLQEPCDKSVPIVTEKGLLIVSIAICGFANFSSVGMQIGGIGELAPARRATWPGLD